LASGADRPDRQRFWDAPQPKHLVTGKVRCGSCGGAFAAVGKDYLGCTAARRQGICTNRTTVRRDALEVSILDALRNQLVWPDLVLLFIEEFTAEWNRVQGEASAQNDTARRELATIERKLDNLIKAIADGLRGAGSQQKLDALEVRKAALEKLLATAPAAASRLQLNLAAICGHLSTECRRTARGARKRQHGRSARGDLRFDRPHRHPYRRERCRSASRANPRDRGDGRPRPRRGARQRCAVGRRWSWFVRTFGKSGCRGT
jgi:hypothetical protein